MILGLRALALRDVGQKAIAVAAPRLDGALFSRTVADGLAQGPHAPRDGAIVDVDARPRVFQQLGPGHHPMAMLREVDQHLVRLGLQRHAMAFP